MLETIAAIALIYFIGLFAFSCWIGLTESKANLEGEKMMGALVVCLLWPVFLPFDVGMKIGRFIRNPL